MKLSQSHFLRLALSILIAFTLALLADPAWACACGGYFPSEGNASINQEHVFIRWDGKTEDIVLTLGVLGASKEAALVFPVPARAQVQLADKEIFPALREFTRPEIQTIYDLFPDWRGLDLAGGAAPGAPPVTLLDRQDLGPFDVSTLAATDANALGDWLTENGYQLAPEIASALQPYVDDGWYYVAVRLSPGASEEELTGELAPLRISFEYDKIVYPMRLSALARNSLSVYTYVLTDHRVVKNQSFGQEALEFAGWVDPATLEKDSPLAAFAPQKLFLTKFAEYIYSPKNVTDDYTFSFAANDETYRKVEYRHVNLSAITIPACLLGLCLVGLLAVGGIWMMQRRNQNRTA